MSVENLNPSIDRQKVTGVTDKPLWPTARLEETLSEYMEYLKRPDIMPRARKLGAEIVDIIIFELACRDGIYKESYSGES